MSLVETNAAELQEFLVFLLKGSFPVMLLLPGDIIADVFAVGRADAERTIALLPCKGPVVALIMNPFRGCRLDIANHIGKAGGSGQAKEEMNMIGHASNSLGNAV